MQLSPQYIDRREKQVAFQQQFLPASPSCTSSLSWGLHVAAIARRGGPSGVTRWNQRQLGRAEKWWTSKAVTGNLPHKSRCPPAVRRRPTVPCAAAASSSSTRAVRRYDHIIISLHHGTRCLVLFSLHLPFPTSHIPMSRPVSFRSSCIHLMFLPSDDHNLFLCIPSLPFCPLQPPFIPGIHLKQVYTHRFPFMRLAPQRTHSTNFFFLSPLTVP